jgi:hypothetical protein
LPPGVPRHGPAQREAKLRPERQRHQNGQRRIPGLTTRLHLISAGSQPDEFLIAEYVLGAEAMMEIFRQRAIEAGHSGAIPEQEKLQSLCISVSGHSGGDRSANNRRSALYNAISAMTK